MGVLYIIATPIGNLKDITLRALNILENVDFIVCEDTRNTRKLLTRYNIHKKLFSYYSYNERRVAPKLLSHLKAGKDLGLVSDSGTPAISDPGAYIINMAWENGISVIPIPGPSAFIALLSVSGYGVKGVSFEGFLSPKAGKRKRQLKCLLDRGNGFVLYESPHRLIKLVKDIAELAPQRILVIGREMTKVYEEFFRSSAKKLLTKLEKKTKIKGEISIFVASL